MTTSLAIPDPDQLVFSKVEDEDAKKNGVWSGLDDEQDQMVGETVRV